MNQVQFADKVKTILEVDDHVIGLAVGGSWLSNQLDEFSDLDLVIVTETKITDNKSRMLAYAEKFGNLLSAFTGEHVGEPRLLVCLYDDPLLHVDLKFVTLEEFAVRIEDPFILLDKNDRLSNALKTTEAKFPFAGYQWMEDRFWTWVHYMLAKIGRGEYLEALDAFGILRMLVLAPLLHKKNNNLPRGVRRVEQELAESDLEELKRTIPHYSRQSLLDSLSQAVELYRKLRVELFEEHIILRKETEGRVMHYFNEIKSMSTSD